MALRLETLRSIVSALADADAGGNYFCELGPEYDLLGRTRITIDGTFYFDREGNLISAPSGDDE